MGIAVLGPLAVDGAAGRLRHHDRVVLTVLAMRPGEVVDAERLADALWGDALPGTWTKVVQGCVVRLRKVLGSEAIETTPQGYRLTLLPDEIDSLRFERLVGRGRELLALAEPDRAEHVLAEAVGLWRGEAFADIDGWGDGRAEAARLEELRRNAEELEIDAALRAGRCREVLDRARRLVDAAPLRERRWALLALAQYHCGEQGEALQALRSARTVLAEELGVDPGPELVALEEAILRQDPVLLVRQVATAPAATCPYRGLVPFGMTDDELFFGRESELDDCLRRLAAGHVLAIVGPSGSGKSSLARAGVGAALARNGHEVRVVTPGVHPMDVLDGLGTRRPPALVVDQCEEAVTLCESAAERAAFFDGLLAHAERAPLVIAVRADQLGVLSTDAAAATLLERGLFLLRPMGVDQLRACIERPAVQSGLLVEPGLTDLLLTELEDEPGALPLLSHALRETWIQREGRTLTVTGYRRSGGIREAVARTAEEVYDAVPETHRPAVRGLLMRLVTEAPDGQIVRARLPHHLVDDHEQHAGIVRRLVDARLLVSDGEDLELAHEALIRAWPRLRQWLEDDVEGRRILQHLSTAAQAWDALGRPGSELYRGVRLAQALDWRQQSGPDLTVIEQEFLGASQALVDAELAEARRHVQQERAARRRTRRLAVGLAAVLAIALVAAGSATWFQQSASDRAAEAAAASTEADANRLAALSKSVRGIDLSMLLAAQAFRTADTPATRDGLLAALLDHGRAERVVRVGNALGSGVLADRGRVLFLNAESLLFAWEVGSARPPRVMLRWRNKVPFVAGAPTDDLVALWQWRDDTTPVVGVFDSRGRERFVLDGLEEVGGEPMGFGFSQDSRRLYLEVLLDRPPGPQGVWLREYDIATGDLLHERLVHRQPASGEGLTSFVSKDGGWSVSWPGVDVWSAVLVENRTARTVPVAVPQRPAEPDFFYPLRSGLALTWNDGAVSLFNETGRQTQLLETHQATPEDVVVAPDGSWGAIGDGSGQVTVWDIDQRSGSWSLRETLPGLGGAVTLSAGDGSRLASANGDGTAVVWDLSEGAGLPQPVPGLGQRTWIANTPAEVSPGRLLVAPTHSGPPDVEWITHTEVTATFLDPRTGKVLDRVPVGEHRATDLFGSSVSVSPDRTLVAVTYQAGAVVLDARSREEVARITLDEAADSGASTPEDVLCSVWTPDASKLLLCATGDGHDDGNLAVVDTTTWEVDRDRVDVGGTVRAAELSPEGDLVALGMESQVVDGTPHGKVKLLDTRTLRAVGDIDLGTDQYPVDVSFSPDGRRLAVGVEAGLVFVADVEARTLLQEPARAHAGVVLQVEWIDDRTVASTGFDKVVTLYDADRGLVRATLPVVAGGVEDGHTYLLSADVDQVTAVTRRGDGRSYPLDPQTWLDEACAVAGRDLTREEWASYLPGQSYERTCSGRG